MAFTVVGVNTVGGTSASDPTTHYLPLPSGSALGDLIVFAVYGANAVTLDDRLTGVDLGYPGYWVGGVGRATTLDDVEWSITGYANGFASCLVLRGVGDDWEAEGSSESDHSTADAASRPGYNRAAVIILDIEFATPGLIPDASWTDHGGDTWDDGTIYFESLAYTWNTGDPVGALVTGESSSGGVRVRLLVYWPTPESRGHLRQRQRPHAGRVRQIPASSRVRQIIP